jgi:hypothetical protein
MPMVWQIIVFLTRLFNKFCFALQKIGVRFRRLLPESNFESYLNGNLSISQENRLNLRDFTMISTLTREGAGFCILRYLNSLRSIRLKY